jgi:hypothetical protein
LTPDEIRRFDGINLNFVVSQLGLNILSQSLKEEGGVVLMVYGR